MTWHDGLLLAFTVRPGRLDGWTQRLCGAEAARRHLDASPEPWRSFAAANAQLAARLLRALTPCRPADQLAQNGQEAEPMVTLIDAVFSSPGASVTSPDSRRASCRPRAGQLDDGASSR